MKKIFCLTLAFLLLLSGCKGNFGDTELKDSMAIPKDGIIEKSTIQQIKDENAIAVFYGESNGIEYEWKIFSQDITHAQDVNLLVELQQSGEEVAATFMHEGSLGFSATLSIYLESKWSYLTASAYQGDSKVYAVSLTGTKDASILNIYITDTLGTLVIRPDPEKDPTLTESETTAPLESTEATEPGTQPDTEPGTTTTTSPNTESTTSTTEPTTSTTEPTQDQYKTDPVPEGMPTPVEPEDQDVNTETTYTCIFSIECSTILNNLSDLNSSKLEIVPSDGIILAPVSVTFSDGESVFDVLQRVCRQYGIHMESSWTPMYNSAYVEGIANLYEFDCGELSGWMYRVNGWYPNYGCSRYQLEDGDVVEWRYTCDLGRDVGDNYLAGT